MKNAVLCFLLLSIVFLSNAQKLHKVSYVKWSNPMAFKTSPSPIITGNGALSDSLLGVFDIQSVYEYNDEYFLINSWADYYEWYTSKFWFQFEMPELYHYYYNADDDYGMANFIVNNFKGKYYPSNIMITCENHEPLACWSPKRVPSKNKEKIIRYRNRTERREKTIIQARDGRSQEIIKMLNSEVMYPVNFSKSTSTSRTMNPKDFDRPGADVINQSSSRGSNSEKTSRRSIKNSITDRSGDMRSIDRTNRNRSVSHSSSRGSASTSSSSKSSAAETIRR